MNHNELKTKMREIALKAFRVKTINQTERLKKEDNTPEEIRLKITAEGTREELAENYLTFQREWLKFCSEDQRNLFILEYDSSN